MIVELTESEMSMAAGAAVMRQCENLKLKVQPAYGAGTDNDWQLAIEGCLGEFALSKHLGVHWSGKGKFRAPDVGSDVGGVDVRTTNGDHHRLILHDDDPDDRVFWLLCGVNGRYDVKGWITGRDGKQSQYWCDPAGGRPAYFVPQSALNTGDVVSNPYDSIPGMQGFVPMTDNDRLVICARDAINELLHQCQDLGLTRAELIQVGDGLKSMVTFKSEPQQAAAGHLMRLLDKPGRVLDRPLS